MTRNRTSALHRHTPDLEAYNAFGMVVRQVAYQRLEAQQPAERRITLSRRSANGQWQRQWDPRLSERLEQQADLAPSQQAILSLSGVSLLDESRDAGWRLTLPGDAGQLLEQWDSRGSHWQTDYDPLLRPLCIRENVTGQSSRVAERFTYASEPASNRRGRLVQHDDAAGTRLIKSYSLTGSEQEHTRYFLKDLDLPDWPQAMDQHAALIDPDSAAPGTLRYSPLGEVLERTDALGNKEHSHFNLAGEPAACRLELADGSLYPLLGDTRYNAFGQIETQTAGNGLVSLSDYDPADGRLTRQRAGREQPGRFQDLNYTYDRVGNLMQVIDLSQSVRHFANQRVEPVSTFTYDSLYQLREATGREAAGAQVGPALPDLAPNPGDTSQLQNYRQLYDYDASGNLLTLQQIGQLPYTRRMNVAEDSNRAVAAPGDPLAHFDANGNLLQLQPGQPLQWNARNQLHNTRQVTRTDAEHDEEHYRYGGDGLRVRKVVTRQVAGRTQRSETRYLPGLELHIRPGERFAVITTQAGRCNVRCLHWSEGQPDGIDNPQLRYGLADPFDSSALELDGAARLISHEGYYPFGGTAWWAARSALEAHYKSHRYSGKERDSSGLYDYGLRYYAPWLARWINPDPAGDVDGLNLYRMVGNNPLRFKDSDGLSLVDALDLADKRPPRAELARAYGRVNPTVANSRRRFSEQTQEMLSTAMLNSAKLSKMKEQQKQRYLRQHPGLTTTASVKAASAHAGVLQGDGNLYRDGFTNLPGSLSPRAKFPGVALLERKSSLTFATIPNEPRRHLGYYLVNNTNAMLRGIREAYAASGQELHPYVEKLIRTHIEDSNFRIPMGAGIPGLHAEIQALNAALHNAEPNMLEFTLSQNYIFTQRLVGAPGQKAGSDFAACYNCSGILPKTVNVVTGRVTPERHIEDRVRSATPSRGRAR